MESLCHLYPVTKTLRFSLLPQGNTLQNIISNGFLDRDEQLAKSYPIVKKIFDDYHKQFIDRALSDFTLLSRNNNEDNSLQEFRQVYTLPNTNRDRRKQLAIIQQNLRKKIVAQFATKDTFKCMFGKEPFKKELPKLAQTEEEKRSLNLFSNFTIYFSSYHESRKNFYTADEIACSIAFRLIHQNLPKFIDNQAVYNTARQVLNPIDLSTIYTHIKAIYPTLPISSLDDMFRLDFFNHTLTQKGIDIYNLALGMFSNPDGSKIKGLNEYINLYNQQQRDTAPRIPTLKTLFKQILSDRTTPSWLPDEFQTDNEVLNAIQSLYENLYPEILSSGPNALAALLNRWEEYDTSRIYIKNEPEVLSAISQTLWKDYRLIGQALDQYFIQHYPQNHREDIEKYTAKKNNWIKKQPDFSIDFLDQIVSPLLSEDNHASVKTYFQLQPILAQINQAYAKIKELVTSPYPANHNLIKDTEAISCIKKLLDPLKELQNRIKPIALNLFDKDERFYGDYSRYWTLLSTTLNPLYNKTRNYITRKPYSEHKIKLNFDAPTLLDGWDITKEIDNRCVLLRKGDTYYLAIMDKEGKQAFKAAHLPSTGDCYQKIDYKQLSNVRANVPRICFSNNNKDLFNPNSNIETIYKEKSYVKGPNFNQADLYQMIDYFKSCIRKYKTWNIFNFNFSDTYTYNNLNDFYKEFEEQGYKLSFRNVSCSYIDHLVEDGKIYLFQIYNKDFSPYSKGLPNLFTLYWKALFTPENQANVVYKLNGQAEIFYRKRSILPDQMVIHPADQPIDNKNALVVDEKPTSVFDYPIIKDRRYTIDKFLFHVPVTLNFGVNPTTQFNKHIEQLIKQSRFNHIIGIDRGERNLLYLVMIDMKGKIILQKSLNVITGEKVTTDYRELLARKESDRQKARQNWQTIEGIKQIKEGYLSQAIHLLSELVITHKALVVLEDLNFGLKNSRLKFEKQVYEKFEKMLIDKFNYLILDKRVISSQPGGVLNAYQLTPKTDSIRDIKRQCGIVYYIPAWNTSKIDPITGFVNFFDFRYESVAKAKELISKFQSITYNQTEKWFEFTFNYVNFTKKAEGTKTQWTLCTYGTRIHTHRSEEKNNNFVSDTIYLTDALITLFNKYGINYQHDLKEQILTQTQKDFFETILRLLRLTVQLRNSSPTDDYILSPIRNKEGVFFDSRTAPETLPKDADANGAYNIARKGLWLTQQILQNADLLTIKPMSNKEWLNYVQSE